MAWASKAGHATTDPSAPEAFGICDRCGFTYNLARDLPWQFDFRGPRLANLRLRICRPCQDTPWEFYKPIVVPPDPLPVLNPRPQQTNTGSNGWGVGGWGTGPWSVGQTWEQPVLPVEYAPPMTMSVDE